LKKFNITRQYVINMFKKNTTLDDSQIESIIQFLQNPLILIQGPPGTGKTVIGALMALIIMHNTDGLKILVLCYTNHALDQFGEILVDLMPDVSIKRMGGFSKSEIFKNNDN